MLLVVLTSFTLNMGAGAQDAGTPEAGEAQSGSYVETAEGQLVVYTGNGPVDLGPATSVYSAPDDGSLVWVTETEDGSAEIRRYTWATGKNTALYQEERPDANAPLPIITDYNGDYIWFTTGDGDPYGFVTRFFIPGITPEASRPTSFDMPVFFYQYGKFGFMVAWDKDAEFLMDVGGGEAGHSTPLFSPDGNFTASITTVPTDYGYLSVTRINDLETVVELQSEALAYYWYVVPIWRWDSGALGWLEMDADPDIKPKFVVLDLASGETETLIDQLSIDAIHPNSHPQPVWWTPDGVAFRYDNGETGETTVIVYDLQGIEQRRVKISDLNVETDSYVYQIVPVVIGESVQLGLHYPARRAWALLDPMTGDLRTLGNDEWIALVPQTNISGAMYGKIIHPLDNGDRVVEMPQSEGAVPVVIEPAAEGIGLSPDGHFYTYLADKVLYMIGANGEEYRYDSGIGIHPPSVSWSPLVGVLISKPTP